MTFCKGPARSPFVGFNSTDSRIPSLQSRAYGLSPVEREGDALIHFRPCQASRYQACRCQAYVLARAQVRARLLHPHFLKQEEHALPPPGLLAALIGILRTGRRPLLQQAGGAGGLS